MYYQINVSREGKHFFATAEHSLTTEREAMKCYDELKDRFPENGGWKITVMRWETLGQTVNFGSPVRK